MGAGRAFIPLFLLVATTLAGCSDPKATLEGDGSLKTNTFVVDSTNKTHGYVTGLVLTEAGNPVPGARVTILSVETSATTDPKGEFNFTGVAKGAQDLRVEKDGYKTLQRPLIVEAGKIVDVEVILARADGLDGGMIDHYHDHWRGQELYTIYEGRLEQDTDVTQIPPTVCAGNVGPRSEPCWNNGNLWIFPDEGRIVPPGTKKITVDVSFEPDLLFGQQGESMQFYMVPPPSPDGVAYNSVGWSLASGDEHLEYELPAPDLVDFGHAKYTNWQFRLRDSSMVRSYSWASGYNLLFTSPIDVAITAHRGELLIDPPHPRYWEGSPTLSMPAGQAGAPQCAVQQDNPSVCEYRDPNPYVSYGQAGDTPAYCSPGCMILSRGGLVPPGSTRITFDLESWHGTSPNSGQAPLASDETEWVLGYKPANAPWKDATWDDYTWIEPLEMYDPAPTDTHYNAKGSRYEIFVEPGQEDEFYTIFSHWIFSIAVRGHEDAVSWSDMACSSEICGRPYFEMKNIVVYNDSAEEA